MPRNVKTQWDFGELFPTEATRRILSVRELTLQVKRLLEKQVGQVWVTGEITNLRVQSSGHFYFVLKDAEAQLSCVLFRGETVESRSLLEDGRKVILQGDLTVYETRGQYQLVVRAVELQGTGALQLAFEKLKQKLKAEGLFEPERKRPLPRYPQSIGLVTSPTGAALRDVLHVVERRNAALEIVLAPCRVQGNGAAEEIAAAIRLLNEWAAGRPGQAPAAEPPGPRGLPKLDLILVTRGGGSLEDLWAFNEEVVARAIYESALPIVSAVGHEIDFTISDFVADVRAATPSAAAEVITEGVFASRQFIADAPGWLRQRVLKRLESEQEALTRLTDRVRRVHPRRRLNERLQQLDDLQASLVRGVRQRWRNCWAAWENTHQRLVRLRPARMLLQRREALARANCRLRELFQQQWRSQQDRLATLETRLRLLSPEQVLARGYSITTDTVTGKVIRGANEVRVGQKIKTKLKSGEIRSAVES
ncbi:MAG: exodeoxyribonuclease VII large subunit [Verrucomicrobiota bacterium]